MYQSPTYRHADEPVKFLGFDIGDWMIFAALFGPAQLVVSLAGIFPGGLGNVIGIAVAFGVPLVLRSYKRGKPRGYLSYLAHRSRLSRLLPSWLRVPGTAPAPRPMGSKLSLLLAARRQPLLYAETEAPRGIR